MTISYQPKAYKIVILNRQIIGKINACKRQKCNRGGGKVISVLAFYSNGLSSNPTEAYSFSV